MINRASAVQQQTPAMAQVGWVDSLVGEAINLTSSELLQRCTSRINLLFAVGSVSHLVGPDKPKKFFAQAVGLLRSGSGRFYLPIQNDLISERSITQHAEETEMWSEMQDQRDFTRSVFRVRQSGQV